MLCFNFEYIGWNYFLDKLDFYLVGIGFYLGSWYEVLNKCMLKSVVLL